MVNVLVGLHGRILDLFVLFSSVNVSDCLLNVHEHLCKDQTNPCAKFRNTQVNVRLAVPVYCPVGFPYFTHRPTRMTQPCTRVFRFIHFIYVILSDSNTKTRHANGCLKLKQKVFVMQMI